MVCSLRRLIRGREEFRIADEQLLDLLSKKFPTANVWLLDYTYYYTTKEEFLSWLQKNFLNLKQYVSEKFDCDNFAFALASSAAMDLGLNCVGIATSSVHAFNLVLWRVGDYPDVVIVEPQNDNIFAAPPNEGYEVKQIIWG